MAPKSSARENRRLETRARLFDTAIAEIGRCGLAGADVTAMANAAGVVRGTFYFHFPTKEHVLVELQRSEEARIVADLRDMALEPHDLATVLTRLVDRVLATEKRLGSVLFREMLGLNFSFNRPAEDEQADRPLSRFLVEVLSSAQHAGRIPGDADVRELTMFFSTGLVALLATTGPDPGKSLSMLGRYVTTILRGMEVR